MNVNKFDHSGHSVPGNRKTWKTEKNTNDSLEILASNKIGNWQIFGHPIFQGRPQYTQITTIHMYLLVGIRHNILTQCHGIFFFKFENFNYNMLEIDDSRNLSPKSLVVLGVDFWVWMSKWHPDAMLAKTMRLKKYIWQPALKSRLVTQLIVLRVERLNIQ